MALYRYSQWDGTQEIPPLDPDDLLEAITDDLMNFGDLQHALRSLLQRGMRNPLGQRLQGLRDLLQQLRQQRRDTLDRYNLSSIFDDIKNRLDEILRMERDTLQRRLQEALEQGAGSGQPDEGAVAQPSPSGQEAQAGAPSREFAQMLQKIAQRKQSFLDNLPEDVPGRIKELQNYEFMDPEAQHRFQELMEMLKEAMTETFFKDLHDQIAGMTPEQLERLKQMVKDLNQMLSEKMAGGEPDFQRFMQQYGDLFGPNPPQSLEELIAQMQHQVAQMENLLDSLPTDMRQQLRDLLSDKIGDPELQAELAELAANLEFMYPMRELRSQYPFRGDEELDLSEAMRLMDHMQAMDELERQLERTQYGGDIDAIDQDKLREILGEEAYQTLQQLRHFLEILEEAGYIRRKGSTWVLTPRGTRKIGQKALAEIYAQLKKDAYGRHPLRDPGAGGERADDIKKYEFGDPFHLALDRTIMNSLQREGPGVPIRIDKDDFEVY
ncbi:MAG: VWA domain-containing protein, partial [Candidatus Bathyarchaeota archaeon]|nr:VWA domain-containing protein [Candidatus Bathyarchaeota archaeon]